MQSLTRIASVLDALAGSSTPMSVQEVAATIGLDRAVVHRLLKALVDEEFVETERPGRFQVGPRSMVYANTYIDALSVRRIGLPYAVDLRDRFGTQYPVVVSLNIRVGSEMTVVDAIWDTKVALDTILQIGTRFPIGRSSTGRCILAYLPEVERRRILGRDTPPQLLERLDKIRTHNGIDTTEGDVRAGINGLAAAIFDKDGTPTAAMSIYGSGSAATDLADSTSEVAVALKRTVDAIGFAVGGNRAQYILD